MNAKAAIKWTTVPNKKKKKKGEGRKNKMTPICLSTKEKLSNSDKKTASHHIKSNGLQTRNQSVLLIFIFQLQFTGKVAKPYT